MKWVTFISLKAAEPGIRHHDLSIITNQFGAGDQQKGFFEFENNYGLEQSLDSYQETCRGIATIDFNRAKRVFAGTHTLEDLFRW